MPVPPACESESPVTDELGAYWWIVSPSQSPGAGTAWAEEKPTASTAPSIVMLPQLDCPTTMPAPDSNSAWRPPWTVR